VTTCSAQAGGLLAFRKLLAYSFAHVTTCSAKARGLFPDLSHIPAIRICLRPRAEYTLVTCLSDSQDLRKAVSYYLPYLIYHDVGRGYDPVGSQFHGSIGAGMNPIYII
jgi:hypothetical protein